MKATIGVSRSSDTIQATEEALWEAINKVRNLSPMLVIALPTYDHDYRLVQHTLAKMLPKTPIIGASSISTFTNGGLYEHSAVALMILAADESTEMSVVTSYSEDIENAPIAAVMNALTMLRDKRPGRHRKYYNTRLLLTYMNAATGSAELIVEELILNTQMDYTIAGGLASKPKDIDGRKPSFVFTEDGVWEDGLVVGEVLSNVPIGVGVEHGWKPLDFKPHRITNIKDNMLIEVDGQVALEFFISVAREHGDTPPSDWDKLADMLHRYQIGLTLPDGKHLLRTPLVPLHDGRILLTAPLPVNSTFLVMTTTESDLIDALKKTLTKAVHELNGIEPAGALIMECLGRKEILGERIFDELSIIEQLIPDVPFIGYHSFGEIAWAEGELSGYHNMTVVVVLFGGEKVL